MKNERLRATSTEIDTAIREIRDFHANGRESIRLMPGRGGFGGGEIDEQARRLGWAGTKLRKARKFATQYPRKDDLDELCKLVRDHKAIFGTAHVGILVTVPKAQARDAVLLWCLKGNHSKADFEQEVQKRVGKRRKGGRRRRIDKDPGRLLIQVEETANTWLRWYELVKGDEEQPEASSLLNRLSAELQKGVHTVAKAMKELHDRAEKELDAKHPAETTK